VPVVQTGEAGPVSKVRIGVIGCGGRAGAHMQALAQRADAEIVAVADVAEAAARRAGERLGVPYYTDHRLLLERHALDTVVICVPVFAHGSIELDVIDRGLPFFVDKPVARDLPTARRIAQALRAKGLWAAVGYQLRYHEPVRRAKAFLTGRTVALVEGHYWCGTARGGSWHNDWAQSGGQLVEQATHTLDLMRYLVGEVEEVFCWQARRLLTGITSPDAYVVALRFADGALGSLSTTWVHDPGDWSHANVLNIALDGCLLHLGGGLRLSPEGKHELPPPDGPADMYGAFLEAVRSGGPGGILSTYEDAVATLAVSLAANESAHTGRPVRIREAQGA
jgi:predicted dehydrogenase